MSAFEVSTASGMVDIHFLDEYRSRIWTEDECWTMHQETSAALTRDLVTKV